MYFCAWLYGPLNFVCITWNMSNVEYIMKPPIYHWVNIAIRSSIEHTVNERVRKTTAVLLLHKKNNKQLRSLRRWSHVRPTSLVIKT